LVIKSLGKRPFEVARVDGKVILMQVLMDVDWRTSAKLKWF
jgi:hypothetical protein